MQKLSLMKNLAMQMTMCKEEKKLQVIQVIAENGRVNASFQRD